MAVNHLKKVAGIVIPDSKIATQATALLLDLTFKNILMSVMLMARFHFMTIMILII
ncbi:hypothetical protein [uncultured Sphingobacterium sp.]|uniref:hypothetical protein n=1 Tax=uncultured Sphingobacterium sp. TaxID=182688 RepID=UPI0025E8456B|nr:hypothetical protein [uncultured Sphingobacterium sp.]